MIGADEHTILDKQHNVAFCGSLSGAINFIGKCREAGFIVTDGIVDASRAEIEPALFKAAILEMEGAA